MSLIPNIHQLESVFPFNGLSGQVQNLFNSFITDESPLRKSHQIPMNAKYDEKQIELSFEMPGVDADKITLTVEGNLLKLNATKELLPEGKVLLKERSRGEIKRFVKLPYPVEANTIQAEYCNGVLSVKLARKEEDKPQKIEVKIL